MKLLSHGPEPCASANSAIPAYFIDLTKLPEYYTIKFNYSQGFFANLFNIFVKMLSIIAKNLKKQKKSIDKL